jgi:hypothetical protein
VLKSGRRLRRNLGAEVVNVKGNLGGRVLRNIRRRIRIGTVSVTASVRRRNCWKRSDVKRKKRKKQNEDGSGKGWKQWNGS